MKLASNIFYAICVLTYAGLNFYLALNGKSTELVGFAAAGAISLVFLKLDAFKEFSGAGFSAKLNDRINAIERDIEPIKSKETEPDIEETHPNAEDFFLEKDTENVLFYLTNGKYSWRTITGLKIETNIPKAKLRKILLTLNKDGLAKSSNSSSGKEIWGATDLGYKVEQLHFPGSKRGTA